MDATFMKNGSEFKLAVERRFAHSPEKVWRVLTERDLLKQWFPSDVEGEWKPGAKLRFIFEPGVMEDLTEEELAGEVLTMDPHRLIEFRWGKYILRYELVADGDGCRLHLSESLDNPSWGARNAAGWEMCLDNLDLTLEGAATAKFAVEVWKLKFDHYVAKFEPQYGPQAGMPESDPRS